MSAPKPPFALPPRYELTSTFFQGGQGVVYVCKDLYLNRDVCIKFTRDARHQEILKSEASKVAGIQSKHVIRLYDILEDYGVIGMVTEFLPGKSVKEVKANDPNSFLQLVYQISSGIFDIHDVGLIHRDIKAENMKFTSEGILKLFDFGLSCEEDDGHTDVGRGTQVYRAPEYYLGLPLTLTSAVDVYAFGVTAWWILENGFPPELKKIPPDQSPSFSSSSLKLPREIIDLLNRTLDDAPASRPKIKEIKDVVTRYLQFGKHSAIFSSDGYPPIELKGVGKTASLTFTTSCYAKVHYKGLEFLASEVVGDVYLNGMPMKVGDIIPGSCVIILGGAELTWGRKFVTCDVSHPEVVI